LESTAGFLTTIAFVLDGTIFTKVSQSGKAAEKRLDANEPDKGLWGNVWQTTKEAFNYDSPNFNDKVKRAFGMLTRTMDSTPVTGFTGKLPYASHMFPSFLPSLVHNTNNGGSTNSATVTQNFIINSTANPQAVADAVANNADMGLSMGLGGGWNR
jgi:hypothetical protein